MTEAINKADIDALNRVTKTLIDSEKGYDMACDMCEESYPLRAEFKARRMERTQLVRDIQAEVRRLGGEPQDSGGIMGAAHRGLTSFSGVFRDNEKAALEAIDDGEDYLSEVTKDALDDKDLSPSTRTLLSRALGQAMSGERFADRASEVR